MHNKKTPRQTSKDIAHLATGAVKGRKNPDMNYSTHRTQSTLAI